MSTVLSSSSLPLFAQCPGYGFSTQPQYRVNSVMSEGGYARVDRRWSHPLLSVNAVPMGDKDEEVIQGVLNFWHALGGRTVPFRFKDYTDYKSCALQDDPTSADQPLVSVALTGGGTGYQLVKRYSYGSLTQDRPITQPDGATVVVRNGSGADQTDFTIDESTGIIIKGGSFSGTPATWGGEFFVPVRFDSELPVSVTDKSLQNTNFALREKRSTPSRAVSFPPVGHGSFAFAAHGFARNITPRLVGHAAAGFSQTAAIRNLTPHGVGAAHIAFSSAATGRTTTAGGAVHLVFGSVATGMTVGSGGSPSVPAFTAATDPPAGFVDMAAGAGAVCVIGTDLNVYRSTDGATTWTQVTSDGDATVIGYADPSTFVIGRQISSATSHVEISIDAGATWIDKDIGFDIGDIVGVAGSTNAGGLTASWMMLGSYFSSHVTTVYSTDSCTTFHNPSTPTSINQWSPDHKNSIAAFDVGSFIAIGLGIGSILCAYESSGTSSISWSSEIQLDVTGGGFLTATAGVSVDIHSTGEVIVGQFDGSTSNNARVNGAPANIGTDSSYQSNVGASGVDPTGSDTTPACVLAYNGSLYVFGNRGSCSVANVTDVTTWTSPAVDTGAGGSGVRVACAADSSTNTLYVIGDHMVTATP